MSGVFTPLWDPGSTVTVGGSGPPGADGLSTLSTADTGMGTIDAADGFDTSAGTYLLVNQRVQTAATPIPLYENQLREIEAAWAGAVNHPAAQTTYLPRWRFPFRIDRAAGLVCSTGSGTLSVKVNGVVIQTEAFAASTGGAGDDRTLDVSVAANDTVELVTSGTFTGFRGTVSGPRL